MALRLAEVEPLLTVPVMTPPVVRRQRQHRLQRKEHTCDAIPDDNIGRQCRPLRDHCPTDTDTTLKAISETGAVTFEPTKENETSASNIPMHPLMNSQDAG